MTRMPRVRFIGRAKPVHTTSEPHPSGKPNRGGAGGEVRRSARNGVIGLAGAAVSGIAGFALAVVITRGFGTAGAGAFFTAIGLFTMVGAICCLGADTALVWALPRRRPELEKVSETWATARGRIPIDVVEWFSKPRTLYSLPLESQAPPVRASTVFSSGKSIAAPGRVAGARLLPVALIPPVVTATLVGVGGVILAPTLAPRVIDDSSEAVTLLRLTFAAVPALVIMTILLAAVRALRPISSYVTVQFLLLPLSRPILIAAVAAMGGGLVIGMGGWLAPVLVALVVCAGFLLNEFWGVLFTRGRTRRASLRPERGDWRTLWGFALPRAVSAAIDSSSMWVGVVMTAALAGPAQAGVFGAVGRYVLAGQLAMQGLRVAVAPQLSRLLGADRRDDAAAVHRQTTTWILMLSWPVYLLLAAFAPGFLWLFGREFTEGATALTVLSIAMLLKVGLGNVQTLLLMSGGSAQHMAATVIGLASTVTLGLVLIPDHGAVGAAMAWAVGIAMENSICAVAARRAVGRPLLSRTLLLTAVGVVLAVGGVCAAVIPLIGREVTGLAVALAVLAVGVALSLTHRAVRAAVRRALATLRARPAA